MTFSCYICLMLQYGITEYITSSRSVQVMEHQLIRIRLTILAWVQAKRSSLQHSGILANVPDVKVYKDWDGGETSNSEPSKHEDVCQHDELQGKERLHLLHFERHSYELAPFIMVHFNYSNCNNAFAAGYNKNRSWGYKLVAITNP